MARAQVLCLTPSTPLDAYHAFPYHSPRVILRFSVGLPDDSCVLWVETLLSVDTERGCDTSTTVIHTVASSLAALFVAMPDDGRV
jgi:hypothetical protein